MERRHPLVRRSIGIGSRLEQLKDERDGIMGHRDMERRNLQTCARVWVCPMPEQALHDLLVPKSSGPMERRVLGRVIERVEGADVFIPLFPRLD